MNKILPFLVALAVLLLLGEFLFGLLSGEPGLLSQ